MYRIRIVLPKKKVVAYHNLDIIHDALIHAWVKAGASSEALLGSSAGNWHFGPLGWRNKVESRVHTLVVGTPDKSLSVFLKKMDPASIQYSRTLTGERVEFSGAEVIEDLDPVGQGQSTLGLVMLSPMVVSRLNRETGTSRWHTSMQKVDLSRAVNHRLSRLAGRPVTLTISPDSLYLRTHAKHDTLVQMKEMKNGHKAFVIGMRSPIVMEGSENDLRLAWYMGIGEKNRMGFGCIGLAERGIGR